MELRQLRFFVEVARAGSFLGAADSLNVAQPSLWRQVRALEAELGVPLFERSGRGVVITSAGTQLLTRTERLLFHADKLRTMADELARGREGIVTIACAHPHVPRFLVPVISTFHARRPGVHVSLHEADVLPPAEVVLAGDADLMTSLPRDHDELIGHRLGEVRLVAVMADDHPWRDRDEIGADELAGVPILTGRRGGLGRRILDPVLQRNGVVPDITLETANAGTSFAMARAGLGVALMADDNLVGDDRHWPVIVDDRYPLSSPLWIYWAAHRTLPPPVQAFVQHIRRTVVAGGSA